MDSKRTIWNNKTIPQNKEEIIEKIKKNMQDNDEVNDDNIADEDLDISINIGIKQIISFIVCNDDEIAALVITPSGLVYNFKSNIKDISKYDIEWWIFALRYYKNYIYSTITKNKISEVLSTNEEFKFKRFSNKDNENTNDLTTMDLFNYFHSKN